jgi:hypothetical protein
VIHDYTVVLPVAAVIILIILALLRSLVARPRRPATVT